MPEGASWDLEAPGSRFALRPALCLTSGEQDGSGDFADDEARAETIRAEYGDWLLDEDDPTLGTPTLARAEVGRGAAAELSVVWWLVEPIVKGVIAWGAVEALKRVWRKARHDQEDGESEAPRGVLVNRGTAILLAAAAVQETYGIEEELVLEAAEEPPTIAGREITETSFFWVEPWVVLLRSHDASTRFVVVVDPQGEVLGTMKTPMGEFEKLYFDPTAE